MKTEQVWTKAFLRQCLALSSRGAALVAAGLIASTTPAAAQLASTSTTQAGVTNGVAKAIEWDLGSNADLEPGAMIVDLAGDKNRIWFVTKVVPWLYRVDLGSGKKVNNAQVFSWPLDPSSPTGGLRRIKPSRDKDRRFVFVRNSFTLQRVDTICVSSTAAPCTRTTWFNELAPPPSLNPSGDSDVAVDDFNNVYAAVAVLGGDGSPDDAGSYIQKLEPNTPGTEPSSSKATRWTVGGSAGFCPLAGGFSAPCLSGITLDGRNRSLVYYSEPTGGTGTGAIAELDTSTKPAKVRRWFLSSLGDPNLREPRQLQFDNDGTLWTVTGSGHLVRLDPRKNQMSSHAIPLGDLNDPYSVAPDGGAIGYTGTALNKVAMLLPVRRFKPVPVFLDSITPVVVSVPFVKENVDKQFDVAIPKAKTFSVTRTSKADGTFVEADIFTPPNDSTFPTGITPDLSASVGTFFYAVGETANPAMHRFGRVRLPRDKFKARVERDDDDRDDDGKRADVDDDVDDDGIKNAMDADNDNDGDPDVTDDDDDDDGIEDDFDTKDKKETKQTSEQDVASGQYAEDAFTVNPSTLLVVASAVSSNVLSPVSVEILNEAGQIVASSLASPGTSVVTLIPPATGGNFTIRVKNQSVGLSTISTKVLTRELWPVALAGGL